jgi:hypothetical protein
MVERNAVHFYAIKVKETPIKTGWRTEERQYSQHQEVRRKKSVVHIVEAVRRNSIIRAMSLRLLYCK